MHGDLKGHEIECYSSYVKKSSEMGWASRKETSKEKRQKRKEGLNSSDYLHFLKRKQVYAHVTV